MANNLLSPSLKKRSSKAEHAQLCRLNYPANKNLFLLSRQIEFFANKYDNFRIVKLNVGSFVRWVSFVRPGEKLRKTNVVELTEAALILFAM